MVFMKKYIAYGSNLNIEQMKRRCPQATIAATGYIPDWRLVFMGNGGSGNYLNIIPEEGQKVPVAIWNVTDADEHNLDIYEGFPRFYIKKNMTVFGDNGDLIDAFAYIMNPEFGPVLGKPSAMYVHTCRDGYFDFKFDTQVLYDALAFSLN